MKQIIFLLLISISIQVGAQVGAPLTVTRPGAKSRTIQDGKNQKVRWITHDHFDEVFIYYGKHTRADVYARVFKDSTGFQMMARIRDSLNSAKHVNDHFREPGGMELHNDKESIYFELHPTFIMTTRDAAPSPFPAFIWTRPHPEKVKKLKAEKVRVETQIKNLQKRQ